MTLRHSVHQAAPIPAAARADLFSPPSRPAHRAGHRPLRSLHAAIATVAAALALPHLASAQVSVLQVEGGQVPASGEFSPVEFGANLTTTSAFFPAISLFTNVSKNVPPGTTKSAHAFNVATPFFGPGSIGATAIDKVYVDAAYTLASNYGNSSLSFYSDTLKVPVIVSANAGTAIGTTYAFTSNPTGQGPVPAVIGNGVRISVHAYVIGTSNNTASDNEIIRRADFMINRDNHVWVAGAVGGGVFGNFNTDAWQPRNGISVRGDAGQTPFDPNLGRAGRKHADIWLNGEASPGAGTVGGYAAALIKQGQTLGSTAIQDARVIKSVLMTGANKTIQPSNFNQSGPAYQPSTSNNLDGGGGAGQVDYNASLAIVNAGQRTYATATGSIAGSTVTAGSVPSAVAKGFALGAVNAGTTQAVLLNFSGPVTNFAATLNWNWSSLTFNNGADIHVFDGAVIAPDLAFDLRPVTWNGSQYVLGSTFTPVAGQALTSNATGSTNDNVEHLYLTSGSIAPGTYALVARGDTGSNSTVAALSYAATVGSTPTWNNNASATFSTGANWSSAVAPNGVSTTAIFPNIITAPRTVDVTTNTTLGSVSFSASNTYTLSSSNASSLTLSNGALGPAVVSISAGAPKLSLPVITPNGGTVAFSGTATSLTAQSIANSGALAVTGAGTLIVPNSITGTGSVVIAPTASLQVSNAGSGSTNVVVLSQSSLTVQGSASIIGNASPAAGPRAVKSRLAVLNTLALNNDGAPFATRTYSSSLDLQSNDLLLHSMTEAEVSGMVRSWWNNGLRNGQGLTSSIAASSPTDPMTTLAVISNNNGSGGTRLSTFDGVSVTAADTLVKFTYLGDLNLSGTVDTTDFNQLIAGLRGNLTGWWNGDTNYDGVVNATDYSNLLTAMRLQGAPFDEGTNTPPGGTSGTGGAIPEPTGLTLLAATLPLLTRRRRA